MSLNFKQKTSDFIGVLDKRKRSFFFVFDLTDWIFICVVVFLLYKFVTADLHSVSKAGRSLIELPRVLFAIYTLFVHETGHLFTCFGGNGFLCSAGGTLFEVAPPLILFIVCMRKSYYFVAELALFWLSYASLGIAKYMADARSFSLKYASSATFDSVNKLNPEMHDWYVMFKALNVLDYNILIAKFVFVLACFGLVIPVYMLVLRLFFRERLSPYKHLE